MKKKLIVIMGVMLMFSLFGCGKKYNVEYVGGKDRFIGAKSSYRAGSTVSFKIVYATDTDYSLYVDDQYVSIDRVDNRGYMYFKFKMPDHDVKVSLSSRNSMVYEDEEFAEKKVLAEYTHKVVGTAIERGSYVITLSTYSRLYNQIVISDSDNAELKEEKKTYLVPSDTQDRVYDLIKKLGFSKWNSLKNYECIDGASYTLLYLEDGEYVTVGSGRMPSDGVKKLQQVQIFLEQCAADGEER